VPVIGDVEMKAKESLLREKSAALSRYLPTLHSNLQLQHQRAAGRLSDFNHSHRKKSPTKASSHHANNNKKWITVDSDGEDIQENEQGGEEEEVMDEEYDEVGCHSVSDSDELEDSDPEEWAISSPRRTRRGLDGGHRLGGRTTRGNPLSSSSSSTRTTNGRSRSTVNYRRGNVDSDDDEEGEEYDSDDMMNNVTLDAEQAKLDRASRLEKRQRQVLQEEGVKKSKKRAVDEVEEVCDVFDSDIIAQSSSSSSSSSSQEPVSVDSLICALCGAGHTDSAPLPGLLLGKHPLKIANKRVWVHDNCALFSPEVIRKERKVRSSLQTVLP